MKKISLQSIFVIAILFALNSCEKITNSNNSQTLYFEYSINGKSARVDCDFNFEAKEGETVTDIFATSRSTKFSFKTAFPSLASEMDKMTTGAYPIKTFENYNYGINFHLCIKAPATTGGTDYFYSMDASSPTYKNEITKISKGSIENNKQAYIIEGNYKSEGINFSSNEKTDITGSYRFKLLTLPK